MNQTLYLELAKYVSDTVPNYETRVQLVLDRMQFNRASLQFCDFSLYSEMCTAVQEYLTEKMIDVEFEDIDIEEVLFTVI